MTDSMKNWLMGIAGTLITAALVGVTSTLFVMNAEIASLRATQVQLIKQIDRTLDALADD